MEPARQAQWAASVLDMTMQANASTAIGTNHGEIASSSGDDAKG